MDASSYTVNIVKITVEGSTCRWVPTVQHRCISFPSSIPGMLMVHVLLSQLTKYSINTLHDLQVYTLKTFTGRSNPACHCDWNDGWSIIVKVSTIATKAYNWQKLSVSWFDSLQSRFLDVLKCPQTPFFLLLWDHKDEAIFFSKVVQHTDKHMLFNL